MPTTRVEYSDDELGLTPGWDTGLDPNIRAELRRGRETAAQLRDTQAENAVLKRERAFTQAGIPADAKGTAFAKLYEGDADDPSAVKAQYEALFGPVADPGAPAGDPAAGDRRVASATSAGTDASGGGTVDLEAAIQAAKSTEEVYEIIRNAPPEAGIRLAED